MGRVLADGGHAGELAEGLEEFGKGAGFGKVGSDGAGEGVTAVGADGAAFVPHGDPEPVRARLLTAAVESAQRRAEIITRAAGTKLGKIVHISYGVTEVRFRSEPQACLAEDGPGAPDIEAGSFSVEDSVTVTWEILD
ncbi:MAG: SIMPL domain-containing protein [Verrucomicrobia bacterium]|nr:SIMPL domain-containing protein [Verrucomicrobiota bacterium]